MGTIEQGNRLSLRRGVSAVAAGLLFLAACSDDKAPAQVINEQVSKVNDQCAEAVLGDAATKFLIIENDGSTPQDELFDSKAKADAEAQPYIHEQMQACMADNLPNMSGYEIKDPTFVPAAPVKQEATVQTTVVTSNN
ncbi:hypothetical protein EB118_06450 [bacterium]|nr:hypothetical protein [bacterium]NBX97714.1 hypothetical protein [bacterium]NDC94213.1 hypothetical protein [bacterium]NDD84402.1 hypothetical protein [bacterium]NDG29718.1 hypothetical protein [bacterium]